MVYLSQNPHYVPMSVVVDRQQSVLAKTGVSLIGGKYGVDKRDVDLQSGPITLNKLSKLWKMKIIPLYLKGLTQSI